ncbi:MAG: hypothetical protein HYS13_04065 [Planctomycetia bacterium]|nr:hypothetical protein [Planctomycetia bacterium]
MRKVECGMRNGGQGAGRAVVARWTLGAGLLIWLLVAAQVRAQEALCFQVELSDKVAEGPVTGRLYVFAARESRGEPRFGPNWFRPEPFFGLDVREMKPGSVQKVDDSADGFPDKLSKLPAGKYRVQALVDHDFYAQNHARGVGNFYSKVQEVEIDPGKPAAIALVLDQVVEARPFQETKNYKEVVFKSELLSTFHRREVLDRCAVILPKSYYDEPEKRYPVIYSIPGFSGSHRDGSSTPAPAEVEVEFIRVMLSGQCKWGHHVYADSATNGPRGQSLVEELIPLIDKQFRTVAAPTARFVTGHSSGGWSSLWLQVSYPDTFGGVWSLSPDPVDFRDWQQVDLYHNSPLSVYRDESGNRRPLARRGTAPVIWYDTFCQMDDVIGRGGQMRSFEAVFSPLGDDGLPRKMWDRQTGRVDPEVVKEWEKYDIRLKLERNWKELGPKLSGKLTIITGGIDTFYLEGAVAKLKESLKKLDSDAVIEIHEGKDHRSVLTPELRGRVRREMSAAYLRHHH